MNNTVNFSVTTLATPDLTSMQNLFLNPANRIPCADYLVKGIVPCFVSMSLSLVLNNPSNIVNVAGLQTNIFNYVNSLQVGQPVAVSQIVAICHSYSNNIARVNLPLVLNGIIFSPYSSPTTAIDNNIVISGNDYLTIPYLPQQGVIPQNTMFFLSYYDDNGNSNININVS